MQIALCDDEETCHEKIKKLITQYKQINSDRTLSLSSFSSGKELINHVDEYGGFDLYILDCIMPEMNGIELGTALRMRDDTGILLYLTTSPDFALDSYRVDAFDYLSPWTGICFSKVLTKLTSLFRRLCRKQLPLRPWTASA